ncbi:CDP-diacylglycerol--glycerol-3-phosphate 3-phosphatidyltransferase [Actinotalea sp. M2MS4P-6]|nr:CDP-diacylglycerol--glycerol-3-phosphate 3-phosphatidyltransferase [Actinotalea sp. M2MS4P-6]
MVWNAPNVVTLARFALVPLVIVALVLGEQAVGWRWAAAGMFAFAAATDKVDGWLARRSGQVTDWGKLVDPIADKALVGTALVVLSILGDLPWWVTVLILVRELGITVMRFRLLRYVVIPASPGGKAKTVLQTIGITLFLMPLGTLPEALTVVAWVVMVAAVLLTVITGLDYVRRGLAVRSAAHT